MSMGRYGSAVYVLAAICSGQIISKRRTATLEDCKQILGCSLQVFPPDGPMFVLVIDLQSTSPLALLELRTLGGNLLHHIFALV